MEAVACSCKAEMVLLGNCLNGSQVWACPNCDVPDKPASKGAKSIIELSEENHE